MARLAVGAPAAIALIDATTDRRISYAELDALVAVAAARLRADGGGLVALFAGNDVASIVELLGAWAAGLPVLLLDRALDAELADAVLDRYRPEVVRGRAWVGRRGGVAPDPALALLLSTSGSTGSRKLVRLSAAAVEANARAIAAALALGPGAVAPTTLPIHYSFGLSVVTSHLAAGATVLVTGDGLVTDGFWAACRRHGATSLAGVPYSFELLRRLELATIAPPSLRWLTQAGGALAPAQVRRFHEIAGARGGGLYVMYGQTEACARIAILPPGELPARAGSVGRALDGGEVWIEVDGRPAAPGEVGEVWCRGPSVMLGYAEDRADLARGDDLGGALATGDLGYLDADGWLWITGRARRYAKVFGLRVSLDEIEAIATAAAPAGTVLAAVADGDRIKIVVEGPADLAAVRAAVSARTGIHPSGFALIAVAALPRLPSGKPDYRTLEGP
ncbi:MAG: AMP-binding protein [Myxococcales bacterium]|nr:AMP-binding protein [Myxococcales bacterium]